MNSNQLFLTCEVPFSQEALFNFYSDIHSFAKLHPLIISVKKQPNDLYKVLEKPFKYLPLKIRYLVALKIKENRVDYIISGIPLTFLTIKYNLQDKIVNCNLQIDSILPFKGFMLKKMMKAQMEILDSLPNSLE